MKAYYIAFMMILIVCGCQPKATDDKSGDCYQLLSSEKFEELLDQKKDIKLIDVRTSEEYLEGHLSNSLNWDISNGDFNRNMANLSKDNEIYVYCRSGGRSKSASNMLIEKGYCKVYELKDGITAWISDGKEIEK